jgi:hypothetical protein
LIRVALAQYQPHDAVSDNLALVSELMERAGRERIDLICFGRDFLGEEGLGDSEPLRHISRAAAGLDLEVLTGRLRIDRDRWAQSALIGKDGALLDWAGENEIKTMPTCLGATLALSEIQAYDDQTDRLAKELKPRVMVMQASAISLLELEAIKELAIDRSFNQAHLVLCVSGVGLCGTEDCLGASLAVFQGEILAEADTAAGELLMFSIDPEHFVEYDELRDPVIIPPLLRDKYGHRK